MIPVLTVAQMRAIDATAIGGDPSIGYSYMLKAGLGLFEEVKKILPDPDHGEIVVLCGKGNNGGDGFVVARLLIEAGYKVMCYGLCGADDLKGEALTAFTEYTNIRGNFMLLSDTAELDSFSHYSLIVDSLLGTGMKGNPRGLCALVIKEMNASGVPILAVDTPSGLDNDTGTPGTPCVMANWTVSMGFPKLGAYLFPGRETIGTHIVKALGYPDEVVEPFSEQGIFIPRNDHLRKMLPPRKPNGSKFDHGLVFMMCGSRGMSGSAALASFAALRAGCGMVHLAAPHSIIPVLSQKLTEVVLVGIDETEEGTPSMDALHSIRQISQRHDAFCIGCGISFNEETSRLVREFVAGAQKPVLLDADGINAYKDRVEELKNHSSDLLITPHAGEWKRLFGPLPGTALEDLEVLRSTAAQYDMSILYKGNPSFVVSPDGTIVLLPFGNSALATAGSGDVLSGIISSLAAQGCSVTDAAVLGTFIHQEAGNAAGRIRGKYSTVASDVLDNIHVPFLSLT